MINLLTILSMALSLTAAELNFMMFEPGELILETDFADKSKLTKQNFQTRKETRHQVNDGVLTLTPPKIAYGDKPPAKSKWAASSMARMAFKEIIPQDYAVSFTFTAQKGQVGQVKKNKYSFFFEFGHRCVRLHMDPSGSKLLIMNHLMKEEPQEKVLDQKELKLIPGQSYQVFAEIKGEEIIVKVDEQVFYGRDPLIKNERPKAFQINNGGAGFILDDVRIWHAGEFKADWSKKRQQFISKKIISII